MGMYDTVLVPCPKCGEEEQFQSKSGECLLQCFKLSECPDYILRNVNRHSPYECEKCSSVFEVHVDSRKSVLVKEE